MIRAGGAHEYRCCKMCRPETIKLERSMLHLDPGETQVLLRAGGGARLPNKPAQRARSRRFRRQPPLGSALTG
jgi:hypothetical protein